MKKIKKKHSAIPEIKVKTNLPFEELLKKALNTAIPKKEKKSKKK